MILYNLFTKTIIINKYPRKKKMIAQENKVREEIINKIYCWHLKKYIAD